MYNFASLSHTQVAHAPNPIVRAAAEGLAVGMGNEGFVSQFQNAAAGQSQETSRSR